MNSERVIEIFKEVGSVIVNDHFVYNSGRHGTAYVNKDSIYPHTAVISELCRGLVEPFVADHITAVVAPAIGGVILTQWAAHHLTRLSKREVLAVYVERTKNDDRFKMKRGYDRLVEGKRVLILEDVLTTGKSVRKTIATMHQVGGTVVGVSALCNRGGVGLEDLGVGKFFSLIDVPLQSWSEEECLLSGPCSKGVPINVEYGHGREFLARLKAE